MIRPAASEVELQACARMMCSTDPWLRLGRSYEQCLATLRDAEREIHVDVEDGVILGFVVINMHGPFVGYIQSICVDGSARGEGIGTELMRFAEERILAERPNVFLCVSSFNPRARALYERLGYEVVGELKDYIIRGASELLMRKSVGPLVEFTPGVPGPRQR